MIRREALRNLAAGSLAALAGPSMPPASGSTQGPNILLVHCHDLGRFLGCYGIPTVRTPNLDAFSAAGVRFERCFATAPSCSPSRASLFTGRYPHSNGVLGLTHAEFAWDLYPKERHLGQILKEAGYQTAGVGVIHETRSGSERCGLNFYDPPVRAIQATDAAIQRLRQLSADNPAPFYLQVGFIEPHRLNPADPRADSNFLGTEIQPDTSLGVTVPGYLRDTEGTRTELAELQGAVHHVDVQFGRLMNALEELGLEENTLVIFTTDHGIAMPRAKCSLYEPGLGIVFLLNLPSRQGWNGGKTLTPMISNVDILPTLLDLTGLPVPAHIQGRSFAGLLDGKGYQPREAIFGEMTYHDYYDPRRSIRTETHKLLLNFSAAPAFMDPSQAWRPRSETVVPENHAFAYHPKVEVFDLERDPWEQKNLADDAGSQEIRKDLLARLAVHLKETNDPILAGAITSPMHRSVVSLMPE
jgi:N-sulfoglucosamine sulfohydrolase